MARIKSQVVYTTLYEQLMIDIAYSYPSNEVTKDWRKIQSRIVSEGFSFLTKTLPRYAKELDSFLASEGDRILALPGLRKKPGSAIPKLFGWLFEKFITSDGRIRDNADPIAIKHCRTLMYFMYKLELPYEETDSERIISSFVQTERWLHDFRVPTPEEDVVTRLAQRLCRRVCCGLRPRDIIPRHGPGAVSTGECVAAKSIFRRIYTRLEREYPFTEYFMLGPIQCADEYDILRGCVSGRVDSPASCWAGNPSSIRRQARSRKGKGLQACGCPVGSGHSGAFLALGRPNLSTQSIRADQPLADRLGLPHRNSPSCFNVRGLAMGRISSVPIGGIHGPGWCLTQEGVLEPTAKVVLVPKDSRGPRLISCEPLEIQFIQQGLRDQFYDRIESYWMTRGHVNFTDQLINRRLALWGSQSGDWATLDLKDASDRVHVDLVKYLFDGCGVLGAIMAARSTRTLLPDGTRLPLVKFAPMGSALCFPILALSLYAVATAILRVHGGLTEREALSSVYVYGDDIIVKQGLAALLLQHLPRWGFALNESKCCVSGFFRESCGCDAYKGVDVTPIRLRKTWSHSKRDPEQLASWADLSNRLWEAGYWRASDYAKDTVERTYGPLPYIDRDVDVTWIRNWGRNAPKAEPSDVGTGLIGWRRSHVNAHHENRQIGIQTRFNPDLHRLEARGYVVHPVYISRPYDGWNEVFRTLTCGASRSKPGTYAVAHRSCLTRKWAGYS